VRKDKKLSNQAARIWGSLRLAIFALLPRAQSKGIDCSSGPGLATKLAIESARMWIARSLRECGFVWTAKSVKAYAEYCRARALRCSGSQATMPRNFPVRSFERGWIAARIRDPATGSLALAQLARLGRAMPEADHAVILQALEKHRDNLSRQHVIEEDLLDAYGSWARAWTGLRRAMVPDHVVPSFSRSAAESVSRAEGGQLTELRQLAQPEIDAVLALLREEEGYEDLGLGGYAGLYSEEDDLQVVADCALRAADDAAGLHREGENPIPIKARAAAIPELGCKARIVTSTSAFAVVAGDVCRKAVWPLLEAEPRVDLSGKREADAYLMHDSVARAFIGAVTDEYYSADMTAATDLMPFALSRSIWSGVCDGLGEPHDSRLRILGNWLLGPVEVSYPDLPEEPTIISRQGCMMGLPISWFVLNLFNLATADLATIRNRRTPPGFWVGRAPAVVRGDDLAAAFLPEEASRYESLMRTAGAEVNLDKSFRSRHGFVLAERTFLIERESLPKGKLPRGFTGVRRKGISPLAPALTRQPDTEDLTGRREATGDRVTGLRMVRDIPLRSLLPSRSTLGLPLINTLPPACASVLAEFEDSPFYGPLCRAILSANEGLVEKGRRFGIPLFVPRSLGGLGFPHPQGFAKALRSGGHALHLRATLAISVSGPKRRTLKLDTDPWASRAAQMERERAELQLLREQARAEASGQLGRFVPVSYEAAVTSRAATGELWADLMLPSVKRDVKKQLPRPAAVREGLTSVLAAIQTSKFPNKFLVGDHMTSEHFHERLMVARGVKEVYVPATLRRPGEQFVRGDRFGLSVPRSHSRPDAIPNSPPPTGFVPGQPSGRAEDEEVRPVVVPTLRLGASLEDLIVLGRPPRRGKRTQRAPRS
jgi:hypothetical protein